MFKFALVCTHLFLTEPKIIIDSFKSELVLINTKLHWKPYLTFIYTIMRITRALWLVVAHDLSEDRCKGDVTENLFWLLCSTRANMARGFENFLWDYFGLKQEKAIFCFHNQSNSTSSPGLLGQRYFNLQERCIFGVISSLNTKFFQIWSSVTGYDELCVCL